MKNGDACASPFLFYNFQMKLYKSILLRPSAQELSPRRAPKLEYPVSATPTHMLRICVNPLDGASLPKGLT